MILDDLGSKKSIRVTFDEDACISCSLWHTPVQTSVAQHLQQVLKLPL